MDEPSHCPNCGIELLPLDMTGLIERTNRYRESYPATWDDYETVVLCADCAAAEREAKDPWER